MVNQQMKIMCLGDSITWGYPHGTKYSWVSMLGELMGLPLINEGVNGDTTGQMLRRFDRSVLAYKPTHLIVMGGINDVFLRVSYDRIIINLTTICKRAEENDIRVILGLPTAVDESEFERMLWRIRKWMREYATEKGYPVIDFCSAFYDESGEVKTDILLPDGGHPTVEGYEAMFRVIDPGIFK
ncbi:MAG: GDSL-type esterase/lipase family protein [Bacillota bacterium]|nr:GDSL-type esterase/lipase family protein [Bacillota bacterium]